MVLGVSDGVADGVSVGVPVGVSVGVVLGSSGGDGVWVGVTVSVADGVVGSVSCAHAVVPPRATANASAPAVVALTIFLRARERAPVP
ncbi:hypothetical protein GCM10010492_43770 [Saccharothrix mutabilis subsp. mutabilis]|uniref:Secreted protein n=1 Tax=Saccharothrix mutabilis subsp. mutabilis TaxID=66855 RepID=A0ABP3DUP3_9PSEU